MKILLTGGAGFIGSHVAEAAAAAGMSVFIVDDFSSGKPANVPNSPRVGVIATDLLALPHEEWPSDLDAVVHFAAAPSVSASWIDLRAAHDANLTGTVHALACARALGIGRFVFASSAAVYGDVQSTPVSEGTRLNPISPYGVQKVASEHYGRVLAAACGMRFVALRFFNVFGPRQDPGSPYSGVISRFIQCVEKAEPVTLRGDGQQTRDFVYVKDVAASVLAALSTPLPPSSALVANIGTGKPTTISELVETLAELHPAWPKRILRVPPVAGDIRHSYSDIAFAKERLAYQPRWSLLAGLADMLGRGQSALTSVVPGGSES